MFAFVLEYMVFLSDIEKLWLRLNLKIGLEFFLKLLAHFGINSGPSVSLLNT